MKSTEGGEIVQVQGGHIVRSTGRKDRHSKVYTSKGPRDRRVRLSAHTAIDFYDVQDRLGYDRPSKAVDWLIKKAKSAIDKLAELPPWNPGDEGIVAVDVNQNLGSADIGIGDQFQLHRQLSDDPNDDSGFLSQSMDHDVIPDTMKSFFPTSSANSSMNFQSYHHPDLTSNHTADLGLSLQSFQNQALIQGQSQASTSHHQAAGSSDNHDTLFPGSGPDEFDAASFHRMMAWSNDASTENRAAGGGSVGDGFGFNQPQLTHQQTLPGHGSGFSQRGSLQSSFYQSIHTWNELSMASADSNRSQEIHQALVFRRSGQGLPGFSLPGRIHGEEEKSVMSDRPSLSSPNSQH